MSTFGLDVAKWGDKVMREFEELRKAVVIELFSSVVLDTPVDEGRLRGNWTISNGTPNTETFEVTDPSGQVTIGKIRTHAENIPSGDVSVFLANNLPYAYRIEYDGWSHTKAPAGMVRKNFIRISDNLKKHGRR